MTPYQLDITKVRWKIDTPNLYNILAGPWTKIIDRTMHD